MPKKVTPLSNLSAEDPLSAESRRKHDAQLKRERGAWGEALAEAHLLSKGYLIVAKNWRSGRNELDLVAKVLEGEVEVLVIVEVKTRGSAARDVPEKSINARKRQALIKSSVVYMRETGWEGECRFDVVAVEAIDLGKNEAVMTHFEDAFWPMVFVD